MKNSIKTYENFYLASEILEAGPHRLVQLLMQEFVSCTTTAKGFMERYNYAEKSIYINKAIDILNGLLMSLDMEKGGEIAEIFDELYRYMLIELVKANLMNDLSNLEKIKNIMKNLKAGWDAIPNNISQLDGKKIESKQDGYMNS